MKGTCTSTQGTACARQPFGNGCAAEVLPKASPPCTFRFLISADDAASSAAMRGWPMDTPDASSELTAWETGYGGGVGQGLGAWGSCRWLDAAGHLYRVSQLTRSRSKSAAAMFMSLSNNQTTSALGASLSTSSGRTA